jgi:hypothetical protein
VSHHTVAKVRKREEGRGHVAHVEKRADTKGRKQPASKPKVVKLEATGSKEVPVEEHKAKMAALDAPKSKLDPVAEFKHACTLWFGKMTPEQKDEAVKFFQEIAAKMVLH